jgi:hypothetical protein
MEIEISRRLKQHLWKCKILTSKQYGFWNGILTNNAIYKLINSVYEGWNNKHYFVCTVCNITYKIVYNYQQWWKTEKEPQHGRSITYICKIFIYIYIRILYRL